MEKFGLTEGKYIFQNNEKSNSKKNIPILSTYNRTLPNMSEVVKKNWHILHINPELRNVFVDKPTISFKRNKNIQDLIGDHLIKAGKVARMKLKKQQGKS